MTADALAVIKGSLDHFEQEVLKALEERTESRDAYRLDALVAMAEASLGSEFPCNHDAGQKGAGHKGAGNQDADDKSARHKRRSATKPIVRIRVDLDALRRGHALPGETCAIPGIGPVPVEIARSVLGDALLELVITNGIDVPTVVTNTRHIRRALRLALNERDGDCCVPGCSTADHLETDHFVTDFSKGGRTEIKNLARLCSWHHYNKTHKGWRLEGGPGHWRFVAPDRHGDDAGSGETAAGESGSGESGDEDHSSHRDSLF